MARSVTIIRNILTERGETVAVAESVTAGNIQSSLSHAHKAMDFFAGGITVYNLHQKVKHLKINAVHAKKVNCVSKRVSIEMARGVTKLFGTEWGVGITGYAAPVPEKHIYSLYAWVTVSYKNRVIITRRINLKDMPPAVAQQTFARYANSLLADTVNKTKKTDAVLDR